jgi:very-short-patch-repair endonuclease
MIKTESPIETMMLEQMQREKVDYISEIKPQEQIGPYRVDFLLIPKHGKKAGIVIECDGEAFHNSEAAKMSDRERDEYLKEHGYKVMRFTGSEIMFQKNYIEYQIQKIKAEIMEGIDPYPTGRVFVEIIAPDGNAILVPK